jgi:hypothetical protein
VNPRIDDVRACRCQPRANPVEQAFAVGREHADPRGTAFRVVRHDHARLRFADARLAFGDLAGVGDLPRQRLREPVAVGQASRVRLRRACLPAERLRQLLLPCVHDLASAVLLVAEPKPLLGGFEQGAQKRPLPFVPDAGAHRANVDHRQDQQEAEPLRALHLPCEILDRLGIGEVALESGG